MSRSSNPEFWRLFVPVDDHSGHLFFVPYLGHHIPSCVRLLTFSPFRLVKIENKIVGFPLCMCVRVCVSVCARIEQIFIYRCAFLYKQRQQAVFAFFALSRHLFFGLPVHSFCSVWAIFSLRCVRACVCVVLFVYFAVFFRPSFYPKFILFCLFCPPLPSRYSTKPINCLSSAGNLIK